VLRKDRGGGRRGERDRAKIIAETPRRKLRLAATAGDGNLNLPENIEHRAPDVYVLKGKLRYRCLIGCLNLALADGGTDNGKVIGAMVPSAYPGSRAARVASSRARLFAGL